MNIEAFLLDYAIHRISKRLPLWIRCFIIKHKFRKMIKAYEDEIVAE